MKKEKWYQRELTAADLRDDLQKNIVADLRHKFGMQMIRTFAWNAICSVAVEAGCRKAEAVKRRRIAALDRMNRWNVEVGGHEVVPPVENWYEFGLFYGYGVWSRLTTEETYEVARWCGLIVRDRLLTEDMIQCVNRLGWNGMRR